MKNFRDMNKAITEGAPSDFVEGLYVQNPWVSKIFVSLSKHV